MTFPLIQELMLLEKISVSSLGSQVRARILKEFPAYIMNWYKRNLKQFPFYKFKDEPDSNERMDNKAGIQMCTEMAKEWLASRLGAETRNVLGHQSYRVEFLELEKTTRGHYDHDRGVVAINVKFVNEFGEALWNNFSNFWFDTGFEEQSKIDLQDWALHDPINTMAEVWTHEVVHGLQFTRSKIRDPYRSYLQKDKKKFYEVIRNKTDDVVYLGSPEEIGAFAQQMVYDLCKDVDHEDTDYQIIAINDSMKYISARGTRYDSLIDNKDPKVKKVLQRFLKKVYEEFDSRRDELFARKKEEMKKAKQQAAYDEWMDELDKELGLA